MKTTIHLALTHDWELRGDGSGDIEAIQFAPLRRLLEIYRNCGAQTTFMPDVMQQIRFSELSPGNPVLQAQANSWNEHLCEAYQQGHDVQLHLHPQWLKAQYQNGRWQLAGDWSILNYEPETARTMLAAGKELLEALLRPMNGGYRCLAFRAGALAAAPSDHLFSSLVQLGIKLDVSIAGRLLVNEPNLQLDYRSSEESFVPYYPVLDDARKISSRREEIICVPLNHFYGSRRAVTKQNISLARRQLNNSTAPTTRSNSPKRSRVALAFKKLVKPALQRKYFVSDTSRLDYSLMREMLAAIRQKASESGLSDLPVVLTNHPKEMRDWAGLERFVGELAQADDVKFITLTGVEEKLCRGEFKVRRAD
jgi:hypothetical protein